MAYSQNIDGFKLSEYHTPNPNSSQNSTNRLVIGNNNWKFDDYQDDIILEHNETEEFKQYYKSTPKMRKYKNVDNTKNNFILYEAKQENEGKFCGFCQESKEVEDNEENTSSGCNVF